MPQDSHVHAGRNDVDVICLDGCTVLRLYNRHLGAFRQQLRQQTAVLGVQVLNEYECHAGIVRERMEQVRECL